MIIFLICFKKRFLTFPFSLLQGHQLLGVEMDEVGLYFCEVKEGDDFFLIYFKKRFLMFPFSLL
jgi:hypothetical protein